MNKVITTITIILIALAVCFLGIWYIDKEIKGAEQEILGLTTEVNTLAIQASRLNSLKQVVTSTGGDLLELKRRFILTDTVLDFVKYIEQGANGLGLTYRINTFDTEQSPELTALGKEFIKTSITVSGREIAVTNFMKFIESLPYNIKVTRSDMRKSNITSVADMWTLSIDFSVVKSI